MKTVSKEVPETKEVTNAKPKALAYGRIDSVTDAIKAAKFIFTNKESLINEADKLYSKKTAKVPNPKESAWSVNIAIKVLANMDTPVKFSK